MRARTNAPSLPWSTSEESTSAASAATEPETLASALAP